MGQKLRWLASFFEEHGKPGHASSKRLVFIVGGLSLSAATIMLSLAAIAGKDVDAALLAVTGALAGLAGYGYVNGRQPPKGKTSGPADDTLPRP